MIINSTKFWLRFEYADGVDQYLFSADRANENYMKYLNHTTQIYADDNENRNEFDWYYRKKYDTLTYFSKLLKASNLKINQSEDQYEILRQGKGLELIAKLIKEIQYEYDEQKLAYLLNICMGAQYFTIVTSKFMPMRNKSVVKVCRFYAYVVLGEIKKAELLYQEIGDLIELNIKHIESINNIIFANILCLYKLRIGIPLEEIMSINYRLVEIAAEFEDDSIKSILLLNQARLKRIMGLSKAAIGTLEESYEIIRKHDLFKIRLYYLLQLSMITNEKEQFVYSINKTRKKIIPVQNEAFGWRLAKLICPKLQADMILGEWSIKYKDKFLVKNSSLCSLYKNIYTCS